MTQLIYLSPSVRLVLVDGAPRGIVAPVWTNAPKPTWTARRRDGTWIGQGYRTRADAVAAVVAS